MGGRIGSSDYQAAALKAGASRRAYAPARYLIAKSFCVCWRVRRDTLGCAPACRGDRVSIAFRFREANIHCPDHLATLRRPCLRLLIIYPDHGVDLCHPLVLRVPSEATRKQPVDPIQPHVLGVLEPLLPLTLWRPPHDPFASTPVTTPVHNSAPCEAAVPVRHCVARPAKGPRILEGGV